MKSEFKTMREFMEAFSNGEFPIEAILEEEILNLRASWELSCCVKLLLSNLHDTELLYRYGLIHEDEDREVTHDGKHSQHLKKQSDVP